MERKTRPLASANIENFEGLREIELAALAYKFQKEEMLSYFDEIKEYVSYQALFESKNQKMLKMFFLKEEIEKMKENVTEKTASLPILFSDFQKILEKQEHLSAFLSFLSHEITKKIAEEVVSKKESEMDKKEKIATLSGSRIQDIGLKFLKMKGIYGVISETMNALSPETVETREIMIGDEKKTIGGDAIERDGGSQDAKDVLTYFRSQHSHAKEIIRKLRAMQKGMGMGLEVALSDEDLALLFGISKEEIKQLREVMGNELKSLLGAHASAAIGIEKTFDELGNIVEKDIIAAIINYSREIKRLHAALKTGRVVETKYVSEIINSILPSLRKDPPTIVYLHGEYGTGKTAIAIHIAETVIKKKAIVVSGSKFLEPSEFTEDLLIQRQDQREFLKELSDDLGLRGIDESSDIADILGEKMRIKKHLADILLQNKYIEELGDKATPNKEKLAKYASENQELVKEIEEEIEFFLRDNPVQSKYVLGAMYKAMKEGRPLIIDEANAISPDVLIAFNDLLTKKLGSEIKTKSGETFKVKEGYCIMWTGNTGERYKKARYTLDPATLSRVYPVKVDFPPQSTELNSQKTVMERLNLNDTFEMCSDSTDEAVYDYLKEIRESAKDDQIFQILLLKFMNDRGGMTTIGKVDENTKEFDRFYTVKQIYKLSMASRVIMDLFTKRVRDDKGLTVIPNINKLIGGAGTPTEISEALQEANISMRALIDNIIVEYQQSGGLIELENFIYQYLKRIMNPKEQVIMYAIFKMAGFFQETEWPNYELAAQSDEKNALEKFSNEFNGFSPVTELPKYKKMQLNGKYIASLKTHNYQRVYLNSLEVLELFFGYMPPTDAGYYERIALEGSKNMTQEFLFDAKDIEKLKGYVNDVETVLLNKEMMGPEKALSYLEPLMEKLNAIPLWDNPMDERSTEEKVDQFKIIIEAFVSSLDAIIHELSSGVVSELGQKEIDTLKQMRWNLMNMLEN